MPIKPDAVGIESDPFERSWDSTDCLLYALGVGAGTEELAFTTENSTGVEQQAVPTMGVILGGGAESVLQQLGTFDWRGLFHGAQALHLHRPLPVSGRLRGVTRIAAIYDKTSAAVVVLQTDTADAATADPLFTSRTSIFLRGEGGWGGDRGPSTPRDSGLDREPDTAVTYRTSETQALLYRLSGDRNPMHSDPAFARQAGFDRPILHGLCTFGFTGRALIHAVCDGDPTRFRSIEGRFSAPVYPGDELTIRIWRADNGAAFQTTTGASNVVIDAGRFELADTGI